MDWNDFYSRVPLPPPKGTGKSWFLQGVIYMLVFLIFLSSLFWKSHSQYVYKHYNCKTATYWLQLCSCLEVQCLSCTPLKSKRHQQPVNSGTKRAYVSWKIASEWLNKTDCFWDNSKFRAQHGSVMLEWMLDFIECQRCSAFHIQIFK